jgi:thiamine-monophosphate kinase
VTRSSERERVRLLREVFASGARGVALGIGDDAAILERPAANVVWSIDASVEGVHFRRDLMTLEDAGYRATMAALSDLAAMGASPRGVLAALTLPRDLSDDDLVAIARGQQAAASDVGTSVIGGNLARGEAITITTTVLGEAAASPLRSGAGAGEIVIASGALGLAGAGLVWLDAERAVAPSSALERAALAFRRPRARIREGQDAVAAAVSSMIDVSDGLATDAAQIADASDVGIELDAAAIVDAELEACAALLGRDAVELALSGGEDYALLATLRPGEPLPPGFRAIGRVTARGVAPVVLVDASGARRAASARGFDHFA